jgi:transposase InsO family protein
MATGGIDLNRELRLRLVDGSTRMCSVFLVDIASPFYTGKAQAVVLDTSVVDVIICNEISDEKGRRHTMQAEIPRETTVQAAVITRAQAKNENEGQPIPSVKPKAIKVTPQDMKQAQEEDSTLGKMHRLVGKAARRYKNGSTVTFIKKRGILHRKYMADGRSHDQVIVPRQYRDELMRVAHDAPMAGHLGTRRTQARVQRMFYWPGICSDINRYCRSCDTCQRTKGGVRKVQLSLMPLVGQPFDRVAVDFIGPIVPMSGKGHCYILVLVDFATRYPEALPLKRIDAETVSESLWTIWTRVGIPREMLTDRGSQFTSEIMDVLQLLGVCGLTTTPYHAQANGLVEHFNATLKTILKRLCIEQPKEWDRYISAALFAYREVP